MKRLAVLALLAVACGRSTTAPEPEPEPPRFFNVIGLYTARTVDGDSLPAAVGTWACSEGDTVDVRLLDYSLDFRNQHDDPSAPDRVTREWREERGECFTEVARHGGTFRSTADSLWVEWEQAPFARMRAGEWTDFPNAFRMPYVRGDDTLTVRFRRHDL